MDEKLRALIAPEERDAVVAPIETALTLPATAYDHDEWFRLEVERIFKRRWMAVAYECEIENPGDVLPFDFLDMPFVAVRGDDSIVRVFHNICPYDGCLAVLRPVKGLTEIETYYHGWRYNLRGGLTAAPYWNGDPDCAVEGLGHINGDLVAVRTETRFGVVFVNLDGQAEDIDQWLTPWRTTIGVHFALDSLVPTRDSAGVPMIEKRTVAANWKTYQENTSINLLHEAFTHALYRKSPEVPRVDENGKPTFTNHVENCFIAFSHDRDDSGDTYDPIQLPSAGHNPDRKPDVGFFSTLYPNVNVPFLDSFAKVNIAIPVSPRETRLMHLRFYRPEALAAPNFADEEKALVDLFDIIHAEDRVAIEAVQEGRRSPVWRQHPYAPFWDTLHHAFNRLVMIDMEQP